MSEKDPAQKLHELVEKQHTTMFTTTDESGALVARPMTIQEVEGWTLRFVTQADNDVAQQSDGSQVNVSVMDGGTFISLSGAARLERDLAKKQELWNKINEAYAGDAEDPNNVILEVVVDSGEYWDSGNLVSRTAGLAKAALGGERPGGENATVEV